MCVVEEGSREAGEDPRDGQERHAGGAREFRATSARARGAGGAQDGRGGRQAAAAPHGNQAQDPRQGAPRGARAAAEAGGARQREAIHRRRQFRRQFLASH